MTSQQARGSLKEIQEMLGGIYHEHDRQYYPSIQDLVLKLVWSLGVFSSAERKGNGDQTPKYLANVFAWWIAICDFCKFTASDVMWEKFPGICYYCGVHKDCECEGRKDIVRISKDEVQRHRDAKNRPETIGQWQFMFTAIYGKANAKHGYYFALARLPEEIMELVECLLPMIDDRHKLMLELADIGARIFALADLLKIDFQETFLEHYCWICPGCKESKCLCDPRTGMRV